LGPIRAVHRGLLREARRTRLHRGPAALGSAPPGHPREALGVV